jgi:hypothetical protein
MIFDPTIPPDWVSGGKTGDGSSQKFYRAVTVLRSEGKDVTEEAVKELYIKYGGLVLDVNTELDVPKKSKK